MSGGPKHALSQGLEQRQTGYPADFVGRDDIKKFFLPHNLDALP